MPDLVQGSIEIILQNQAPSGAYVACPNMPDYAYCWFRDGAFIAYAMDVVGEHDSAKRFYDWGGRVVNERANTVERALQKVARGEPLGEGDYLHTRYTLEGREGSDDGWPNFQLDGPGTWLWGMAQHLRACGLDTPPPEWRRAAQLVARYLAALWQVPSYDLWEEFGEEVHPYTLAAIFGGLRAYEAMTGDATFAGEAQRIRRFVLEEGVCDGRFVKFVRSDLVDASSLGLSVPYRLVSPHDSRMQATAERIAADLRHGAGGVHRYVRDTYYGGGEWLLLAAWLGWYDACTGQSDRARELLSWVAGQADEEGCMPEQTTDCLLAPAYCERWVNVRGPIARPLLWSHAMYLILSSEIQSF
jgi:GH15 family glucan-1,4-alpha-glucosidase